MLYLVKTTWPISTVFRLYLENLNWVPNAQFASGPTPRVAPPPSEFLEGINALQALQDRGQIVFGLEERSESLGGPVPAASVTASNVIDASKDGSEYRPDPGSQLGRSTGRPDSPSCSSIPRPSARPKWGSSPARSG